MSTIRVPYRRENGDTSRRRRPFGQGIMPPERRPVGNGWHVVGEPENRPDRLTFAELQAMQARQTITRPSGPARPAGPAPRPTPPPAPSPARVEQTKNGLAQAFFNAAEHVRSMGGELPDYLADEIEAMGKEAISMDAFDLDTYIDRRNVMYGLYH